MAPLIVMLIAWSIAGLLVLTGLWHPASPVADPLRIALAVMFGFTAVSHFVPRTRADLIRMVPAGLPAPGLLVSLTGLAELLGAAGLLLRPWAAVAAWSLAVLLVAMFPANIRAARSGLPVAGRRAMPLRWRLPLQLFWIGGLVVVARHASGAVT